MQVSGCFSIGAIQKGDPGDKGDPGEGIAGFFTTVRTISQELCERYCHVPTEWHDDELREPKNGIWVKGAVIQLVLRCDNGDNYVTTQRCTSSTIVEPISYYIIYRGVPGNKGNKGAKPRIRDWAPKTAYLAGIGDELFYDVVVYDKKKYLCISSHTSIDAVPPTISISNHEGKWIAAQDWEFYATKLLLAERIAADQIDCSGTTNTNKLVAKNADISGKITAKEGLIGNYKIDSSGITSVYNNVEEIEQGNFSSSGTMELNADFLRFTETNHSGKTNVIIGKRAISPLVSITECPIYVSSICTGDVFDQLMPTICACLSAEGSKNDDDNALSGNHALYIPKGDICGFRRKTRRFMYDSNKLSKEFSVSTMDGSLIAITADKHNVVFNLPTNAEDGQEYIFVHTGSGGWMHIKAIGSSSINRVNNKEFISKNMEVCHVIYDAHNKIWFASYL